MKRLYWLLLLIFLKPDLALAFDMSGLQPVAPDGVFSTFSTESRPRGRYSFEIGLDKSKDPDFYRFLLKGAYGISDSLEFNVTLPLIYQYNGSVDGVEDMAFGLKHRFYDEGKYGPSLAYMLVASLNNGRTEFSTSGSFGFGLLLSKRVGPFKGNINVLYAKPGTGKLKDELSLLAGVELSASHNLTALGELLVRKPYFSGKYDQVETRLGCRLKTTGSLYTTFGAGFDLKKRDPELRFIISVSFVPSGKKQEIKKIIEEE